MKKEITLQDVLNAIEKTDNKLTETIEVTNKTVAALAAAMYQGFGKIHHEIEKLDNKIDEVKNELTEKIEGVRVELTEKIEGVRVELTEKIEGVRTELTEKIESVKVELSEKIETEVENLALMSKREFDAITLRFNNMDNEFKEVHEEIGQVNNNVIGIERRVSKLEKVPVK